MRICLNFDYKYHNFRKIVDIFNNISLVKIMTFFKKISIMLQFFVYPEIVYPEFHVDSTKGAVPQKIQINLRVN